MFSRGCVYDMTRTQPRTPYTPTILPTTTSCAFVAVIAEVASGLGSRLTDLLDQALDALGRLRAILQPVFHALHVELQRNFLAGGDGIEEPHALDKAAVTGAAAVRHHDLIERTLLRTTARKSNRDHCLRLPFRIRGDPPGRVK